MDECRARVEQALAAIEAGADKNARREMKLHAALAHRSCTSEVIFLRSAWPGRRPSRWRRGLAIPNISCGRCGPMVFSQRQRSVSRRSGTARKVFHLCSEPGRRERSADWRDTGRCFAILSWVTTQVRGATLGTLLLTCPSCPEVPDHSLPGRPAGVRGRLLARILWLQGFPDQAMRTAESCVDGCSRGQPRNTRCATLWPWGHARSRYWSAIWPRQNTTWAFCSIIRQSMRWRSGTLRAEAMMGCSPSSAAILTADCGCCVPALTNSAKPSSLSYGPSRSWHGKALAVRGRSPTGSP